MAFSLSRQLGNVVTDFGNAHLEAAEAETRSAPKRSNKPHDFNVPVVQYFHFEGAIRATAATGQAAALCNRVTGKKKSKLRSWHNNGFQAVRLNICLLCLQAPKGQDASVFKDFFICRQS